MSLFASSGCSTGSFPGLGYLLQAGRGQFQLSFSGRPLGEVVADPQTPESLRELLRETDAILQFGVSQGLKPTQSYQKYVHLDRDAAVWVVTASESLAFRPKSWNFPLVGSFQYLGWFDRKDATEYAERLNQEGWDTDVRGAGAYSTLGWFKDPLLSTMISSGPAAFGDWVNVLLHESVHATVFVKGQSSFNESLADFVADELTPLYLQSRWGLQSKELLAWREAQSTSRTRAEQLHEAYSTLNQLYEDPNQSQEAKLQTKNKVLAELKESLRLKRKITNATLIGFKTYQSGTEGLKAFYAACGSNPARFLEAVGKIEPDHFPQAHVTGELDAFLIESSKRLCPSP